MDQLVREETQRLLSNQMREAKLQRQIQVRQQAMAWTEATRRKFEEAREKEIKELAAAVTGQVQNTAIQNIEELTRIHDLEMAEIGMAHRAAAGFQNVERLKSLKRLKNEAVAKNRGSAAIIKHAKDKEVEAAKSMAILKRKEEVRKLEDRLSKDLISRRPLTVSNTNPATAPKIGQPNYHQNIAKTLRTAITVKNKPKSRSATAHSLHKASQPSKVQAQPKSKVLMKSKSTGVGKDFVKKSSSSDLALRDREQRERDQKSKEGALKQMVRIKTSAPSGAAFAHEDFSDVGNVYGVGVKFRQKYAEAARGEPQSLPAPVSSQVRYFDANVPQGEVKYMAPDGLSVQESRKMYSPDAWQKGRKSSEESIKRQQEQALKDEEVLQKAAERGALALKKAKLEKQLAEVKNELLTDVDYNALGTGNQQAILGLDSEGDKTDSTKKPKRKHEKESQSSDEFSEVDEDESFDFPTDSRLKNASKSKNLEPLKKADQHKIKQKQTQQAIPGPQNLEDKKHITKKPKRKHQSQSSDEFTEVDSEEGFEFPPDSRLQKASKKQDRLDSPSTGSQQATPSKSDTAENTTLVKLKIGGSSESTTPTGKSKRRKENRKVEDKIPKEVGSRRPLSESNTDSLKDSSSMLPPADQQSTPKTSKVKSTTKPESRSAHPLSTGPSSAKDQLQPKSKVQNQSKAEDVGKDHVKRSSPGLSLKDKEQKPKSKAEDVGKDHVKTVKRSSSPGLALRDKEQKPKSKAEDVGKDHVKTVKRSSSPGLALRDKEQKLKSKDESLKQMARTKSSAPSEDSYDISSDSAKKRPKNISEGRKPKPLKEGDNKKLGKGLQPIQKLESEKDKKQSTKNPKRIHESQSSDEFTEVDSEESFEFSPEDISKGQVSDRSVQVDLKSPRTGKRQGTPDKSDSTENSTLLNLKILEKTGSTPSGSERSTSSTRSKGKSSSAENSTLVNLKILEDTASTPSRSEQSTSSTTDYYSPPDGPFTSTPDGKLHPKSSFSRSDGSGSSGSGGSDANKSMKSKTLYYYLDKFLKRRPDSIEHLPVSSSSSSVIRADSGVLSSDSYKNSTAESANESLARSSFVSTNYTLHRSDLSVKKSKKVQSREKNDKPRSDDSGSTIAGTAIRAGPKNVIVTTSSGAGAGAGADDTSFSTTNKTSSSGNDDSHVSSDSLAGLLRVLSNHQDIEKRQSRQDDYSHSHSQQPEVPSSSNSSRGGTKTRAHNKSNDSADTSGDSIPDASAILRRLISRQAMHDSSRSSSSSPKSGPEKEAKRVELLSDVTPVKFYETPPRNHQRALNDSEIISDVFENLFEKLNNLRIEKPPWVKNSKDEGN